MEEKSIASEMLSELKKTNKRWFLISVFLLISLLGSNIAWLIYESQYEYVATDTITTTTMQDVNDEDLDNTSVIQY